MTTPSSTRSEVEAAEKAFKLAESRFLANDIAAALRTAREAQRRFRAHNLPASLLANAVAAYEVHAAASSRRNWYAVLAVAGNGDHRSTSTSVVTHDSLKQQYRRLCLLLHPDKNHSAAADGAFKLLRQAWDALSLRHPPGSAAVPPPASRPKPAETPVNRGPPFSADAANPKTRKRPRTRTVNCHHCGYSFTSVVDEEFYYGVKCIHCKQWVSKPAWRREPEPAGSAPPPPPNRQRERSPSPPPPWERERETSPSSSPPPARSGSSSTSKFPCPGKCTRCGAKYTARVSVGTWHIRCEACHVYVMVCVRNPYYATTV
uniref:J domain-containing protein n=1 Tax=Leersia perrieri TaxID=77586 RepID=A0A0D9W154_9ORYZ